MYKMLYLTLALSATGICGAVAQDMRPGKVSDSPAGQILTTSNDMTLYTYTRDMTGFSNCNGQCVVSNPPLMAAPDAKASGAWTFITRDDGKKQWAYKGKALYTSTKDSKPGDTGADEPANSKWHVAKP
jgi:predicted lipoprotein with Yx(FWY)xxD motif